MKYNNKKLWEALLFLVMISVMIESCAKVRAVETIRDFNQLITDRGLCVVMFYGGGNRKDSTMRKKIKQLNRMFEEVSSTQAYDDADLVFAKVNVARNSLKDIAIKYKVKTFPSFVLFKNGRCFKDKNGNTVLLHGFVTSEMLKSFVDTYCGKEIAKLDLAKENEKKRRVSNEKSSWLPYFYSRDMFVEGYDPSERSME